MNITLSVTTTGDAGSATGSAELGFPVRGVVDAVKVDYHADAPATTDILVSESTGLAQEILDLDDTKTDGTYYPRHSLHDTDGTENATLSMYWIDGKLKVEVEGCDALDDAVVVTVSVIETSGMH